MPPVAYALIVAAFFIGLAIGEAIGFGLGIRAIARAARSYEENRSQ